jgi:hypothetical protein
MAGLTEVIWALKAVEDIIVPFLGASLRLVLGQWVRLATWLGRDNFGLLGVAHDED